MAPKVQKIGPWTSPKTYILSTANYIFNNVRPYLPIPITYRNSQLYSSTMTFSDRMEQLLDRTFENKDWFKRAVDLGANPIFVGIDLVRYFKGDDFPMNLALVSMEYSGDLRTIDLLQSLKQAEHFDKRLAEYTPKNSNVTLNIWESFKREDHTKTCDLKKLFTQDINNLRTAVLYYNGGKGELQRVRIKNHPLPWKTIYRVELPHCPSVYNPARSLDWVFVLHNDKQSNASDQSLSASVEG